MAQVVSIKKSEVKDIDHSNIYQYIDWHQPSKQYIAEIPGKEHYKLLTYITKQLLGIVSDPVVSDLGTLYGSSALAFISASPTVKVTTYDVINQVPTIQGVSTIVNAPNVSRKMMSAQLDIANIAMSHIVFLDIDPHDGIEELKIVQMLKDAHFSGILIANGINVNDGMRTFWKTVELPKHDVSDIGHWTGTGLVLFKKDKLDVLIA